MCYARPVYIAVMAKQKAAGCCQLFLRYQLLMLHNLQTDDVRTEASANVFTQYYTDCQLRRASNAGCRIRKTHFRYAKMIG
jgi:hypothetical protein